MKKLLLIPALMGTLALATDYNYEISPVIGYNVPEGNLNLDNDIIGGVEVQFNGLDSAIKPELFILHSNGVKSENLAASEVNSADKTNITRVGVNGVYEFTESTAVIPFAKAGVGYETMSQSVTNNSDGAFVDAGAGVKVPFTENLALKLEALYMLKYNDNSAGGNWGDSNLAVLAGLTYSFGKKAQKAAPVPVDGDDDNDGVLNSQDKCPTTPAGQSVNAEGCFVDGDDDNDGVLNSQDKCPTTPAGKSVNAEGCFVDGDDDNDGVLNSMDKCPTTEAGQPVNAEGCVEAIEADDDNDGIANSLDICPATEIGKTVNEDGCPTIVKLHIKFPNDSAAIDASSEAIMQKYADFLKTYTSYSAKIVGHTNNLGEESYNQMLSEKRANAVRDMLIEKGAPAESLTASGEGEANPTVSNDTREGRAENRRIEAELTKN